MHTRWLLRHSRGHSRSLHHCTSDHRSRKNHRSNYIQRRNIRRHPTLTTRGHHYQRSARRQAGGYRRRGDLTVQTSARRPNPTLRQHQALQIQTYHSKRAFTRRHLLPSCNMVAGGETWQRRSRRHRRPCIPSRKIHPWRQQKTSTRTPSTRDHHPATNSHCQNDTGLCATPHRTTSLALPRRHGFLRRPAAPRLLVTITQHQASSSNH